MKSKSHTSDLGEETDIAQPLDLGRLNTEATKKMRERNLPLLVIEQGFLGRLKARPIQMTRIPSFPITPTACRIYSRLSKRRDKIWSSLEICCQAIGYLSE